MPQIAEIKDIDGYVWVRIPMELGSPVQILSPSEIEENQERVMRYLDEIDRLRTANSAMLKALKKIEQRTNDPVARSIAGETAVIVDQQKEQT